MHITRPLKLRDIPYGAALSWMVDAGGGAVHDTAAGVRVTMVLSEARGCKVYDTLIETRRLVSSSGIGTMGTDVAPASALR